MTCEANYPGKLLTNQSPAFADILTGDDMLNLSDPTVGMNPENILGATKGLNQALNGLRNLAGPVNYPYSQFCEQYPTLCARADQSPLTLAEVALFSRDFGVDLPTFQNQLNGYAPGAEPNSALSNNLKQLDTFLNNNMGKTLSNGTCAAFPNIFGQIAGLISLVQAAQGLIDSIKNFDPKAILEGLVAKVLGPLKAIAEAIKKTIDNLVNSFKQAAKDIAKQVETLVADIKAGATKILNKVKNAVKKVLDFLSEPNTQKLKDLVEGIITGAATAFEKMTPVILGLLMFRFCQLSEAIQSFLQKPLDTLRNLVTGIVGASAIAKSMSLEATKDAVEAGAIRFSPDERQNIKDEARKSLNDSAPKATEIASQISNSDDKLNTILGEVVSLVALKPYAPKVELTEEEAGIVMQMGTDAESTGAPGKWKFTRKILTITKRRDGVDTGKPGPGWMEVHADVWKLLLDVAEQMGSELEVTFGFADDKPMFQGGMAVCVRDTDPTKQLALIIAASRAGFKGIHAGQYGVALDASGGVKSAIINGYDNESIKLALKFHKRQKWGDAVTPPSKPPETPAPPPAGPTGPTTRGGPRGPRTVREPETQTPTVDASPTTYVT